MTYEKEWKIVEKCRNRIVFLLRIVGVFPYSNSNYFCKMLPYLVGIMVITMIAGCMNFVYVNRHSLMIVLKASGLIFAFLTVIIKV